MKSGPLSMRECSRGDTFTGEDIKLFYGGFRGDGVVHSPAIVESN